MDNRLTEQFYGEEKFKVGSKVRGDEGFGVESSEEEKVSRLVWNLINKGDCFLKLIDHPKIKVVENFPAIIFSKMPMVPGLFMHQI